MNVLTYLIRSVTQGLGFAAFLTLLSLAATGSTVVEVQDLRLQNRRHVDTSVETIDVRKCVLVPIHIYIYTHKHVYIYTYKHVYM